MVAQPLMSNSEARGLTEADMVLEDLAERGDDIAKRTKDLVESAQRVPTIIADMSTAERATAFVKQLTEHEKIVEDWRKKEKGKWDVISKAVQTFFVPMVDGLHAAKMEVNRKLLGFHRERERVAAEQRQAAIEAARKAQEEAERIARAAQTDADLDRAIEQESVAQTNMVTAASIQAPTQIRATDYGVTASVRRTVAYEVTDESKLPREMLMVNVAAIKARIAARQVGQLPAPVPGIRWFWNETMVSR